MNKILIGVILLIAIISCKGHGRGPLAQESFENDETYMPAMSAPHGKPVINKIDVKIAPCADCITIEKIIANKKDLAGKTVSVKGMVTKVNEGIMDKNWIHIQDGTESEGIFDFTVTSNQTIKNGDSAIFKGTIAVEKDFGFGYSYDIIMENAQITR
ncbi:MAG: hypothetical protein LBV26_03855 [Bacteroidales bacterium]|jgi:hypothetical protein|nr:hypothetical protein [Bacteroidales bacterium]